MPGRKVALIVANANYSADALKLSGPLEDAHAFRHHLVTEAGFHDGDVAVLLDITAKQLLKQLKSWSQQVQGSSFALFVYSGHGLEYQGEPIIMCSTWDGGADLEDIKADGVELQWVHEALQSSDKGMIILDACRAHASASTYAIRGLSKGTTERWITRGAQNARGQRPQQRVPCLIAQACLSGGAAIEQEDQGVFTAALFEHLFNSNQRVMSALSSAAEAVEQRTQGRQVPQTSYIRLHDHFWEYPFSKLPGSVCQEDPTPSLHTQLQQLSTAARCVEPKLQQQPPFTAVEGISKLRSYPVGLVCTIDSL